MNTLALVAVSVPLTLLAGGVIGLPANEVQSVRRFVDTVLDLMQPVPTFAYLSPQLGWPCEAAPVPSDRCRRARGRDCEPAMAIRAGFARGARVARRRPALSSLDSDEARVTAKAGRENNQRKNLERVTGIEPVYSAWKAAALPLSYTRLALIDLRTNGGESWI